MPNYTVVYTAAIEREFTVEAPTEADAIKLAATEGFSSPDNVYNVDWFVYGPDNKLSYVDRAGLGPTSLT